MSIKIREYLQFKLDTTIEDIDLKQIKTELSLLNQAEPLLKEYNDWLGGKNTVVNADSDEIASVLEQEKFLKFKDVPFDKIVVTDELKVGDLYLDEEDIECRLKAVFKCGDKLKAYFSSRDSMGEGWESIECVRKSYKKVQ